MKHNKGAPVSILKKELDRVYSLWIRQKYSEGGLSECVTCGKIKEWRYQHCGHYVSRTCLPLRWDEKNTHVQCVACNLYKEGNKPNYTIYLIKEYGNDVLEYFEAKKNNTMKLDRTILQALISEYKQKIESIGGEVI